MGEKEIENLTKVLRDTEKDLRYYISENGNLRVENKELKEEVQKLKNENTKLGIEKIKVEYEKEIERLKLELKLELKETKEKITLQTRTREISDKQVKEIKELRASGLSYREIEEKTKWSKFTIGRVLKGEYDK